MCKSQVVAIGLTALMFVLSSPASAETRVSFSTGFDYSTGDYGQAVDTEVMSIPMRMRVSNRDWSVSVSVPYLSITGPADVVDTLDGSGGTGSGATVARMGTESGFGDTSVTVTRSFRNIGHSRAYFDASGRVRLPTGDEDKGLGVGATDYTVSGELGTSGRAGGGYLSLGRRFLGDRNGSDRQDGWQATAGGWMRTGEKTRIGAFYFWRESSFANGEDPSEIGASVSYRLTDSLRISANVTGGLSNASPDYSTGIRFTWRSEPIGD